MSLNKQSTQNDQPIHEWRHSTIPSARNGQDKILTYHKQLKEVVEYLEMLRGKKQYAQGVVASLRTRLTKEQCVQFYEITKELLQALVQKGEERKKKLTYVSEPKRRNERAYREMKEDIPQDQRAYHAYIKSMLTMCERIMCLNDVYDEIIQEEQPMECTFEEFLDGKGNTLSTYIPEGGSQILTQYVESELRKKEWKGATWEDYQNTLLQSKRTKQVVATLKSTGRDKTISEQGLFYLLTKHCNMELVQKRPTIVFKENPEKVGKVEADRYERKHTYEIHRPKVMMEDVKELFTRLQKKKPILLRMQQHAQFLDERLEEQKEQGGILTYTLQGRGTGEGLNVLVLWDKRTSGEYTAGSITDRMLILLMIELNKMVFGLEDRQLPQGFCPLTELQLADEQPDFTHTAMPEGSMQAVLRATGQEQLLARMLYDIYEQILHDVDAFERYEQQGAEKIEKEQEKVQDKIEAIRLARWETTEVVQSVMNKYAGGIRSDYSAGEVKSALETLGLFVETGNGDHKKGKTGKLTYQKRPIVIDMGRKYHDEFILKGMCREQGIPFPYLLVALDKTHMHGTVQEMICEDMLLRLQGEEPILVILEE